VAFDEAFAETVELEAGAAVLFVEFEELSVAFAVAFEVVFT